MNNQQGLQPRASINGFGHRKVDREIGSRSQTGKTNSSRLTGLPAGNKGGGCENPSRERLVYLTTCLIGHHVEVQVTDGSIFSGIFHATNAEKDFGVILKMARLIRDSSLLQKNKSYSIGKPISKTLIIPAKEFVQITAKAVSVSRDGLINEVHNNKLQDIMTDSCISQSRHIEVDRELERWVPDDDDRECPELENIFDGPWNRSWDQFEANETLFGVKSTFNEELYTTKLERGPLMRELEKEASRIAREIEGEVTEDIHLAEERGIHIPEHFEVDEETRFSSVFRVEDSEYDDAEDILLDSCYIETSGVVSGSSLSKSLTDLTSGKNNDGAQASPSLLSVEEVKPFQSGSGRNLYRSLSNQDQQLLSMHSSKIISTLECENRVQDKKFCGQHAGTREDGEKQKSVEEVQQEKSEDSPLVLDSKIESSDKGTLSSNSTAYAISHVSTKGLENASSPSEPSEAAACVEIRGATLSGSSVSRLLDCGSSTSASSGPGLSPSSSMGSLSSEKSTLNPHAKEFKLNPNAKSYIPSHMPVRPASPVSDSSFYFPANVASIPHMHGMPVGIRIGSSFAAHQPVIYNPQAAPLQSPQAYFHANGPQVLWATTDYSWSPSARLVHANVSPLIFHIG